jgi:cephalosporin hydroxylase
MTLTNVRAFFGGKFRQFRSRRALRKVLQREAKGSDLEDWERSLTDPSGYYFDCVRYFHASTFPDSLKQHRRYFQQQRRGFGEDAFHVMWWLLFQKYRPSQFLEIGVYRGQTLSLASLLQRTMGISGQVVGVSPFDPSGDQVSSYLLGIDYLDDTFANFAHFGLVRPELIRSFSTDPAAVARISSSTWDAIYIDGNHDYEIVRADWDLCASHVVTGGLIVLDDSALETSYRPPAFATAGHPGPSQVALEVEHVRFREIMRVGHNRVFQKL